MSLFLRDLATKSATPSASKIAKQAARLATVLCCGIMGAAPMMPAQANANSAHADSATASQSTRVRWRPKPERGNARGTLSGGRRGGDTVACGSRAEDTSIRLLATREKASLLTTQAQPTLAWQVTSQQPVSMELIVRDVTQPNPVLVQRFEADETQTIETQLPASAALSPDRQYRWTVIAQCPSGQKSEIYARSFIRRVSGESLDQHLSGSSSSAAPAESPLTQAQAYAAAGIWYDTVASLLMLPGQLEAGQPAQLLAELLDQAETAAP